MRKYDNITVETENELAVIKLSRDNGTQNYLSRIFLQEILDAFNTLLNNQKPKVIILTGSGRVFSLGADLAEIELLKKENAAEFSKFGQSVIKTILHADAITIAALNGMALGGGFELALACDIRWAHSRTVMGCPECLRGLIPAWGGTQLLKSRMPVSLAFEMVTTGLNIGIEVAARSGLVNKVFEGKDFELQVRKEAERFLKTDRTILLNLKKLFQTPLNFGDALDLESRLFSEIIPAGG